MYKFFYTLTFNDGTIIDDSCYCESEKELMNMLAYLYPTAFVEVFQDFFHYGTECASNVSVILKTNCYDKDFT